VQHRDPASQAVRPVPKDERARIHAGPPRLQYRDADAPPVVTFYDVFALLLPGGLEALEQQFLELFHLECLGTVAIPAWRTPKQGVAGLLGRFG